MNELLLAALLLQNPITDTQIREVHSSALLIDTHNDAPSRTVTGIDIGKRTAEGHTDIPRLRAGGVGAVFFSVYVAADYAKSKTSAHRALDMIDTVRTDIIDRNRETFELATTAAQIESAHSRGKIAALLGLEGGHAIEDDPRLLRDFYALGVRYMTLTHTNTNGLADSAGDIADATVAHHNGLTDVGRQVVAEMNRLGIMVDISHVADKTFRDVLEVSKAPVIASHSSCRALANVPRNMTDEMIAALGKQGGVIQINFNCSFLKASPAGGKPAASLDDVVRHINHAVHLAGIDHVGIGSDFDGVSCTPTGLEDVSKFPSLTRALLEKGYTPEQIRKIYGGNILRVMRAVETVSRAS